MFSFWSSMPRMSFLRCWGPEEVSTAGPGPALPGLSPAQPHPPGCCSVGTYQEPGGLVGQGHVHLSHAVWRMVGSWLRRTPGWAPSTPPPQPGGHLCDDHLLKAQADLLQLVLRVGPRVGLGSISRVAGTSLPGPPACCTKVPPSPLNPPKAHLECCTKVPPPTAPPPGPPGTAVQKPLAPATAPATAAAEVPCSPRAAC